MLPNHDDPRVKKTRRGLRAAFIRLILRQGYDSISIQNIADEADTARITFYRHYRDKEELLTDCMNTLYEELVMRMGNITVQALRSGYTPVKILYDHIEEQETLYRILFSSRGTQIVIERMRYHLAGQASLMMQQVIPVPATGIPLELLAHHAASAQIGLAIWWLDHHKPYPAEYMARVALWVSLGGVLRGLGIEQFQLPIPLPPA